MWWAYKIVLYCSAHRWKKTNQMLWFCSVCLQVKAKLAKHFLKLKLAKKSATTPLCLTDLEPAAAPKAAPKAAAPEVDASPAAPKADSLTAKSSLVGEFVRITDEATVSYTHLTLPTIYSV